MIATNIESLIEKLLAKADEDESNAGFAGEHNDGGAGQVRAEVAAYRAGAAGVVPERWKAFAASIAEKEAEDRAEYERLKAKFGDL